MIKLSLRNKTFTNKATGAKFATATARKDYLEGVKDLKEDTYYSIRLVNATMPVEDGIFEVECDSAWLDKRDDFIQKNIVRAKGNIKITKIK